MNVAVAFAAIVSLVVPAASASEATPPAPAIAPDFQIVGSQSLSGRCGPQLVAPWLASVLGAFNGGRAIPFARRFTADAAFEPYSGRPAGSYRATGRAAIASVTRKRHRAGDGWTAFRLVVPVSASGEAIFGLFLRVRADGVAYEQGVKVIVSCSTG